MEENLNIKINENSMVSADVQSCTLDDYNPTPKREMPQFVLDVMTAMGKDAKKMHMSVGENGYTPGQVFHTTNAVGIETTEINGKQVKWPYISTQEGTKLSLKSLMGVRALGHAKTSGECIHEYYTLDDMGNKVKHSDIVCPQVIENFNFKDAFQPENRAFDDFLADVWEKGILSNKKITFLGTVVNQFTAKKPQPEGFTELYDPGYKRALSTKLWKVE